MSLSTFIMKRLVQAIPLLFIISIISFIIISFAPGDVIAVFEDPAASHASTMLNADKIKKRLGLDQPVYVRYYEWMKLIVLDGNLGNSFQDGQPVLSKISERMPATLWLTGTALLISILLAVPIGIYSALKKYSVFDFFFTGFSYFGISIPTFFLGIVSILIFSYWLDWVPPSGMRDNFERFDPLDRIIHVILPASVLAIGLIASKSRYLRNSMLEVMNQDFISTARAKGLHERKVVLKHAFRNALLPIITVVTLQLPILFGGAFIIEQIFAWPGIGRMAINAVFRRDFPIIIGTTMVSAVSVVLFNLFADVLYYLVDPRIRFEKN